MKKIIIDTDTASDDAVALVMALREPALKGCCDNNRHGQYLLSKKPHEMP